MARYTLPQYRRLMRKRLRNIERGGDRSAMQAAKYMLLNARRMAPRKRGILRANIRKRKLKKGNWLTESWVPGQFKYNKWVNRSPGFKILHYKVPNFKFGIRAGETLVYGLKPADWHWTGTAKYWDIAAMMTEKKFKTQVIKNTRKAMRAKI